MGKAELKKSAFMIYQDMRFTDPPPFLYQSLLNLDKSVLNLLSISEVCHKNSFQNFEVI
jgi:hypothetical protein